VSRAVRVGGDHRLGAREVPLGLRQLHARVRDEHGPGAADAGAPLLRHLHLDGQLRLLPRHLQAPGRPHGRGQARGGGRVAAHPRQLRRIDVEGGAGRQVVQGHGAGVEVVGAGRARQPQPQPQAGRRGRPPVLQRQAPDRGQARLQERPVELARVADPQPEVERSRHGRDLLAGARRPPPGAPRPGRLTEPPGPCNRPPAKRPPPAGHRHMPLAGLVPDEAALAEARAQAVDERPQADPWTMPRTVNARRSVTTPAGPCWSAGRGVACGGAALVRKRQRPSVRQAPRAAVALGWSRPFRGRQGKGLATSCPARGAQARSARPLTPACLAQWAQQ
jgi:hypothetical protein